MVVYSKQTYISVTTPSTDNIEQNEHSQNSAVANTFIRVVTCSFFTDCAAPDYRVFGLCALVTRLAEWTRGAGMYFAIFATTACEALDRAEMIRNTLPVALAL